jgi:serine/threonine-protein kinase PpkA
MQKPVIPSDFRPTAVPNTAEGAPFPRIPGYRFIKRLGQGGMASVYLATQESLDRPVSIKVMEREALQDEISMQRFENEARTIAKLTHPSIVNIYEVGRTADARMYYIMPYLSNGDLSERDLRNDEARIVEVLQSLLSALDYAHARGVVHRDVKEENVLFDVADRPMLTDFGIALSKRDRSRITTAGLAVGSSGYMAPEQARGDEVDGRADLYSVGVLAYELLTGKLPFRSPDALALALMHAQKPIPRLPPAKRHWQAFIDRAMAKSPDQRFRDAHQMVLALDRIGRRTGNDLSRRMLRRIDYTADIEIWKHPGMIALGGALLIAIGLYSARDQLPEFGASAGSMRQQPIATHAAQAPEPASINAVTIAPAQTATPAGNAPLPPTAPVSSFPSTGVDSAPTATAASPASVAAPVLPAATIAATRASSSATSTVTSLSPNASITPDAAVLSEARDALAHANLTSPADDNAADLTRMAWKLSPATPNTKALAADVLKAISVQQALAINQHHDQRVLDYQQAAQQLADTTIGRTTPSWRALHTSAASAIEQRVQLESNPADAVALKRTRLLAKQLDLSSVYAKALATEQQKAQALAQQQAQAAAALKAKAAVPKPVATGMAAGFIPVPHAPDAKDAVALARYEVTRGEYAQFVNATHRAASACSDRRAGNGSSTQSAANNKTWNAPGFDQSSDQPVVCVSWNDANAYVQWLSAKNGQRYRLAATADWHAMTTKAASTNEARLAGNYTEWLQNCAFLCIHHLAAGRAWREYGADTPAGLVSSQGFDDVGFRVAREQDAHR